MKNLPIKFLKWLLSFFLEDDDKVISEKIKQKKESIDKIDKEIAKDITVEEAKDEFKGL